MPLSGHSPVSLIVDNILSLIGDIFPFLVLSSILLACIAYMDRDHMKQPDYSEYRSCLIKYRETNDSKNNEYKEVLIKLRLEFLKKYRILLPFNTVIEGKRIMPISVYEYDGLDFPELSQYEVDTIIKNGISNYY